jgi:hypothetical protein
MDQTKDVQGVAVYAEFARPDATTQIIITPDGYDNFGRLIGVSVVRRTVTAANPKKPWRFSTLDAETRTEGLDDSDKDSYCARRMATPSSLFDQLIAGDWKMVNVPILIEVSKKDLDDIGTKKTPAKFLYRVGLSRTALGFPAALINASV